MTDEVVQSQRIVMEKAADIANHTWRNEFGKIASPIKSCYVGKGISVADWKPFRPDWEAKSGFGLKMNESDYVFLNTDAARERMQEIVSNALSTAMHDGASLWIGPMLNDLFSSSSTYVKFT